MGQVEFWLLPDWILQRYRLTGPLKTNTCSSDVLIQSVIQPANQVAAVQFRILCRYRSRASVMFTRIRSDSSNFDQELFGGSGLSQLVWSPGIFTFTAVSRVYQEWCEEKTSCKKHFCNWKTTSRWERSEENGQTGLICPVVNGNSL